MTVAELQLLLSDMSKFLRAAEAKKVADDLEYIGVKLTPFKEYKLKAFADFVEKCEAASRGEPSQKAKSNRGGKKKSDPAAIEQAIQRVLYVYDRATDPNVSLDQIEATVQTLQDLDAAKTKLVELAKKMGSTQKFRSKADAIKAIRQKIVGRKGAFDRVNA